MLYLAGVHKLYFLSVSYILNYFAVIIVLHVVYSLCGSSIYQGFYFVLFSE